MGVATGKNLKISKKRLNAVYSDLYKKMNKALHYNRTDSTIAATMVACVGVLKAYDSSTASSIKSTVSTDVLYYYLDNRNWYGVSQSVAQRFYAINTSASKTVYCAGLASSDYNTGLTLTVTDLSSVVFSASGYYAGSSGNYYGTCVCIYAADNKLYLASYAKGTATATAKTQYKTIDSTRTYDTNTAIHIAAISGANTIAINAVVCVGGNLLFIKITGLQSTVSITTTPLLTDGDITKYIGGQNGGYILKNGVVYKATIDTGGPSITLDECSCAEPLVSLYDTGHALSTTGNLYAINSTTNSLIKVSLPVVGTISKVQVAYSSVVLAYDTLNNILYYVTGTTAKVITTNVDATIDIEGPLFVKDSTLYYVANTTNIAYKQILTSINSPIKIRVCSKPSSTIDSTIIIYNGESTTISEDVYTTVRPAVGDKAYLSLTDPTQYVEITAVAGNNSYFIAEPHTYWRASGDTSFSFIPSETHNKTIQANELLEALAPEENE